MSGAVGMNLVLASVQMSIPERTFSWKIPRGGLVGTLQLFNTRTSASSHIARDFLVSLLGTQRARHTSSVPHSANRMAKYLAGMLLPTPMSCLSWFGSWRKLNSRKVPIFMKPVFPCQPCRFSQIKASGVSGETTPLSNHTYTK